MTKKTSKKSVIVRNVLIAIIAILAVIFHLPLDIGSLLGGLM